MSNIAQRSYCGAKKELLAGGVAFRVARSRMSKCVEENMMSMCIANVVLQRALSGAANAADVVIFMPVPGLIFFGSAVWAPRLVGLGILRLDEPVL